MVCPPNTTIVVRSNYGDESIALIQYLYEHANKLLPSCEVIVVYIHTGWAASHWASRVAEGIGYVERCSFKSVGLSSQETLQELVGERKAFPSSKFQWCANFLKGLPLLTWLDEHDPAGEWVIALPKRQALYQQPSIVAWQEACELHGERALWHPILTLSEKERDEYILRAGWTPLGHRSLECSPCIHSHEGDLQRLSEEDRNKLTILEQKVGKKMFPTIKKRCHDRRHFSMGCGDFFGCGL